MMYESVTNSLQYVPRKHPALGDFAASIVEVDGIGPNNLRFAYDIVVVGGTEKELQVLTARVENRARA